MKLVPSKYPSALITDQTIFEEFIQLVIAADLKYLNKHFIVADTVLE